MDSNVVILVAGDADHLLAEEYVEAACADAEVDDVAELHDLRSVRLCADAQKLDAGRLFLLVLAKYGCPALARLLHSLLMGVLLDQERDGHPIGELVQGGGVRNLCAQVYRFTLLACHVVPAVNIATMWRVHNDEVRSVHAKEAVQHVGQAAFGRASGIELRLRPEPLELDTVLNMTL